MTFRLFTFAWLATALIGRLLAASEPDRLLLQAVEKKDKAGVRRALEAGANLAARDERGYTALHLVANEGGTEIMAMLLKAGADPDAKTDQGLKGTPLMWATSSDDLELGVLLLKHGASVNAVDKYGDHALNWAVYQGNLAYTELLLIHSANPKLASRHGAALDIAMRRGFAPIMQVLADAIGLPGVGKSSEPLLRAVEHNNLQTAKKLLTPDTVATRDRYDRPLLQLAVLKGNEAMVSMLLDGGAEVDQTDRIGFTPLMVAARDGNRQLCDVLLQAGAVINRQSGANSRKLTALTLAVIGDHETLVSHLLRKGAGIDLGDANGNTPLILAVAWGRAHLVKLLLARGARTDLQNDEGQTAASLAERYQLAGISQLLRGS